MLNTLHFATDEDIEGMAFGSSFGQEFWKAGRIWDGGHGQ